MNTYVKNINRIEFVVTMACTGNCKYSGFGVERERNVLTAGTGNGFSGSGHNKNCRQERYYRDERYDCE